MSAAPVLVVAQPVATLVVDPNAPVAAATITLSAAAQAALQALGAEVTNVDSALIALAGLVAKGVGKLVYPTVDSSSITADSAALTADNAGALNPGQPSADTGAVSADSTGFTADN